MPVICIKKFRYRKAGEKGATWRTFRERDALTEPEVIAFATPRGFCIDTAPPPKEAPAAAEVAAVASAPHKTEIAPAAEKEPDAALDAGMDESAPAGRRPRR